MIGRTRPEPDGLSWAPPAELCDRTLRRLFPDAPSRTERWPTLLWSTGRADLPGHPRLTGWQWAGAPESERAV
ncbi:hypothetical protein [Kitasatospora sp. GP82]|uniref:hypothetical protein n=1 Tax=Kitasatospora sp. GP82 TaxID=3035089 RepID=UPI00247B4F5C|nr:hypothetical protein [Kitasatospora sp. GP82]